MPTGLLVFDDEERGDLRLIEKVERGAGQHVGRDRARPGGHHLVDGSRQEVGAEMAAEVAVGDDADEPPSPSAMPRQPKPFSRHERRSLRSSGVPRAASGKPRRDA